MAKAIINGQTIFGNVHIGGGGGHTYSTTEQVVGTWIDGSPLYEKTVSVIITNESAQTLVTIADAEFKRIEGFLAIANQGASDTIIPVPYNDNTTLFVPYSDGDSVKLAKRNAGDRQGETIVLTIQYTKSTDNA